MAAITPSWNSPITDKRWRVITWETITEANTGGDAPESVALNGRPLDLIVAGFGTWGSMTITIEGSLDDTNYFGIKDLDGSAISLTDDAMTGLRIAPLYIKPVVSGGSTADVDILLFVRFLN